MKKTLIAIAMTAAVISATAQTTVTTAPNGSITTNVLNSLGLSGAVDQLWSAIGSSDILQATNYSVAPYLTYAPQAKDKVGGGFLAVYDVPQLTGTLGGIGTALGMDWLGQWSLVSANVTLYVPTHPLAHAGIFQPIIPISWTNTLCTPFAVAGVGTPMSSTSHAGAATLWDIGYQVQFGHFAGGKFGAGVTWGEWMNAGVESSHRFHLFVSWQKGF